MKIKAKGRPFLFPSPNNFSANSPACVVGREKVLGLYNQMSPNQAVYVSQEVKNFFKTYAFAIGWDTAYFVGNQCFLAVRIAKKMPSNVIVVMTI